MKKTTLIIIAVAVILVALLYSLPKIVVDNDSEKSPQASKESISDSSAMHEVSAEQSEILGELRESYFALETDDPQRQNIAEQLCKAYQSAMHFDSAVYLAEDLAKSPSSNQSLRLVIVTAYEAFSISTKKEDQEKYSLKVREYFEKLPKDVPEYLDLKAKTAMTWIGTDQPMNGIMMLREVLAQEPNHREATFSLGMLSMQSGQFKKAVERFEALTLRDTTDVQAWFYLGVSEQELGNSTNARKAFNKVKFLENDPSVIATVDNYLKELNN
jgi:predicted Zn-dependent protease